MKIARAPSFLTRMYDLTNILQTLNDSGSIVPIPICVDRFFSPHDIGVRIEGRGKLALIAGFFHVCVLCTFFFVIFKLGERKKLIK